MPLTESAGAAWVTSGGTGTVTSGSFTPSGGSLLVAVGCIGNGNDLTSTAIAITDSLTATWTTLASHVNNNGASSILAIKDAGSSPSSQTVTCTGTSSPTGTALIVRQFTGALPAAQQNGATVSAGTTPPYTESITPTQTGSQVVGGYSQSTNGVTLTANGSTTIYSQAIGTSGDTECAFEANSLSTALVAITVGFTTAGTAGATFSIAEILAQTFVPNPPIVLNQSVKRSDIF